jgi:SagB-type dehydrogenase family enzyme
MNMNTNTTNEEKEIARKSTFHFRPILILLLIFILFSILSYAFIQIGLKQKNNKDIPMKENQIKLPAVKLTGEVSVEEALQRRRSVRTYRQIALDASEISQILWASYGITDSTSHPGHYFRTAPSAGALYPIKVYLVLGQVHGIPAGLYEYHPHGHFIELLSKKDLRKDISDASMGQKSIENAPASILILANYNITAKKYGERGKIRYVPMEAGHVSQNIYLQCTALKISTCAIAAFNDKEINEVLENKSDYSPLYIMPLGK